MQNMTKIEPRSILQIENTNFEHFIRRIQQVRFFGQQWDDLVAHALNQKKRNIVNDADCWIWTSTVFKRQRANSFRAIPWFWVRDPISGVRKQVYARRYAWKAVYGFDLRDGHDGQWIGLFRCKNDYCVNPCHGTVTTASDWKAEEYRQFVDKVTKSGPQLNVPNEPVDDPLTREIAANRAKSGK